MPDDSPPTLTSPDLRPQSAAGTASQPGEAVPASMPPDAPMAFVWRPREILLAGCLLLACGVVIGLLAGHASSPMPAPALAPANPLQKWEYGTLHIWGPSASWRVGTQVITGIGSPTESEQSLYKQLTGQVVEGKNLLDSEIPEQRSSVGSLLDYLGREGWELVSHLRSADGKTQTWTSKRPRP
jgi:hypothetical protein